MSDFQALTAYGVTIPKAFPDRKAAMEWARITGPTFPGSRIVMKTASGMRTIWRHAYDAHEIEAELDARMEQSL